MKRVRPEQVRRSIPEAARRIVEPVLDAAETWELEVYLVGGPVRDHLLERGIRDVDLVVVAGPGRGAAELARRAAPAGARPVVHDRFGTVRLEAEGAVVDLGTARSERYPSAGALPEVTPAGLEEDLARRDFTVNAMAIPLSRAARRGRPALIDPGSGLADLEQRVLRVFHAHSFHDDPTRALRAGRLAPRLGFSLARATRAALRDALRDGTFGSVTGERFRTELEKLFEDPRHGLDPARALRLLAELHVLAALEPGLMLPTESLPALRRLGRLVAEPAWEARGSGGTARPWVAGLMLWLAPLPAPLRRRALQRLAVRGDVAQRISGFPRARDTWLRSLARSRGRGAADAALHTADEDAVLALAAWADANLRRRIVRWAAEDRTAGLPVSGRDLTDVGLRGPAVGRALSRIRLAWLDRVVRDRTEALALARELADRARNRERRSRGGKGS